MVAVVSDIASSLRQNVLILAHKYKQVGLSLPRHCQQKLQRLEFNRAPREKNFMKTLLKWASLTGLGLALLASCGGTPTPPTPPKPEVGLAVGVASGACVDNNGATTNGTAIVLVLRDKNGALGYGSTVAVSLKIKGPSNWKDTDGSNEIDLRAPADPNFLVATQDYFYFCRTPIAGNYNISGTVAGENVSASAVLSNTSSQAGVAKNIVFSAKESQKAAVAWQPASSARFAYINLYRGYTAEGGGLQGYWIGSGEEGEPPTPVVTRPDPPDPPERPVQPPPPPIQSDGVGLPTIMRAWINARGLARQKPAVPVAIQQHNHGLRAQMLAGASVAITAQDIKGQADIVLAKPLVKGETYYPQIWSSSTFIGANTRASELTGQADINISYGTPTIASLGAPYKLDVAAGVMQIGSSKQQNAINVFTSTITAPDGWPNTTEWNYTIRKTTAWIGNGKFDGKYNLGNEYLFSLNNDSSTEIPLTNGTFNLNFSENDPQSTPDPLQKSVTLASAVPSLIAPSLLELTLNTSSLDGFTMKTTSDGGKTLPYVVYVYEKISASSLCLASTSDLVASQLVNITPGARTNTIPAFANITLSPIKPYCYLIIASEQPLDKAPSRWDYSKQIDWLAILDNVGGNTDNATATVTVTTASTSNLLKINTPVQFQAVAKNASGQVLNGKTFAWTSSNPGIASVDSNGNVTAKRLGSVVISASSEGQSGSSPNQTSYGLELNVGNWNTANGLASSAFFKYRNANGSPTTQDLSLQIVGPSGWNNNTIVQGSLSKNFNWDFGFIGTTAKTGTFQATTTNVQPSFSSSFNSNSSNFLAKISGLQSILTRSNVTITWNPVAGAKQYLFQIFDSQDNLIIIDIFDTPPNGTFRFNTPLPVGSFYIEITALSTRLFDDTGLVSDPDTSPQINFSSIDSADFMLTATDVASAAIANNHLPTLKTIPSLANFLSAHLKRPQRNRQ
jgi:hypothetical protein